MRDIKRKKTVGSFAFICLQAKQATAVIRTQRVPCSDPLLPDAEGSRHFAARTECRRGSLLPSAVRTRRFAARPLIAGERTRRFAARPPNVRVSPSKQTKPIPFNTAVRFSCDDSCSFHSCIAALFSFSDAVYCSFVSVPWGSNVHGELVAVLASYLQ